MTWFELKYKFPCILYRDMGFYCLFMYILSRIELVVAQVKNEAIIKQ